MPLIQLDGGTRRGSLVCPAGTERRSNWQRAPLGVDAVVYDSGEDGNVLCAWAPSRHAGCRSGAEWFAPDRLCAERNGLVVHIRDAPEQADGVAEARRNLRSTRSRDSLPPRRTVRRICDARRDLALLQALSTKASSLGAEPPPSSRPRHSDAMCAWLPCFWLFSSATVVWLLLWFCCCSPSRRGPYTTMLCLFFACKVRSLSCCPGVRVFLTALSVKSGPCCCAPADVVRPSPVLGSVPQDRALGLSTSPMP